MARIFTPRNATAAVVGLGLLASGAATATAAGKSAPVKSHKITAAESQQVKDAVAVALPGFTAKKVSRDAKGGFDALVVKGKTHRMADVSSDFSTVVVRGKGGTKIKAVKVRTHGYTIASAAEAAQAKAAAEAAFPGFTLEGKVRKSYADGSFRLNLTDGTTVKELAVSADFSTVTERPADDDDAAAPTPEAPATS